MRWKTKTQFVPKHSQKRSRRVFAWRWTKVGAYTVWLEFYWVRETYFQPACGSPGWWKEVSRDVQDYY